jgi:hypothetical protein
LCCQVAAPVVRCGLPEEMIIPLRAGSGNPDAPPEITGAGRVAIKNRVPQASRL